MTHLVQFRISSEEVEKLKDFAKANGISWTTESDLWRSLLNHLLTHQPSSGTAIPSTEDQDSPIPPSSVPQPSHAQSPPRREGADIPELECIYGAYVKTKDQVYCDNPRRKDRFLPIEACQKCWERRQYVRTRGTQPQSPLQTDRARQTWVDPYVVKSAPKRQSSQTDPLKAWYYCPKLGQSVMGSTMLETCEDCLYDKGKPCQNFLSLTEKLRVGT